MQKLDFLEIGAVRGVYTHTGLFRGYFSVEIVLLMLNSFHN